MASSTGTIWLQLLQFTIIVVANSTVAVAAAAVANSVAVAVVA